MANITISIHNDDLETLALVVDQFQKYKRNTLSARSKSKFEYWNDSFEQQLAANAFKVNSRSKNTFQWFIDQVAHSKAADGTPLAYTPEGKRAIEICRAASDGQISYNRFRLSNNFDSLFE